MVIKRGTNGGEGYVSYPHDSNLTEIEKLQFHILSRRFPLEQQKYGNPILKNYYDSIVKIYPQMLDVKYYKYLLDKASGFNKKPYKYTTTKVHLTYGEYKHLVSKINESGYWRLPYEIMCEDDFFDGYGYSLEANTKNKYNFVQAYICNADKNRFAAICQEIVNCAGLEKQIDLLWFTRPKKPEASKHVHPQVFIQDVTLADVKEDSSRHIKHKKHKK